MYSKDFERQFTATIYVPNVRNYLHVQKTDTEGKPLPDAEFSLYKSEDVIVSGGTEKSPERTYALKGGAEPYDTATTAPPAWRISPPPATIWPKATTIWWKRLPGGWPVTPPSPHHRQ